MAKRCVKKMFVLSFWAQRNMEIFKFKHLTIQTLNENESICIQFTPFQKELCFLEISQASPVYSSGRINT